ncbi:RDD family protein [Dactylosporangium vinaceum]|uniref:RDD family protein n=1 Tax=Dactylosporangium vinaceum TaxID=53362 RepID=A0ABV5MEC4_9ACTN|nr:RDD family protein [Dactylosporangium vinaceum]UAB92437.1 RDD family protein [Dactylosporangium vinaceum]
MAAPSAVPPLAPPSAAPPVASVPMGSPAALLPVAAGSSGSLSPWPPGTAPVGPAPSALLPAPPRRAGLVRRAAGWGVDYCIVMVPGLLLVAYGVANLVRELPGYVGAVAAGFGVSRLIGLITHRGAGGESVGGVAAGAWLGLALPLLLAILAVPLLQFVYQASLLVWRGRTVGKMLADTKVVPVRAGARVAPAVGRAFATTLVETGLVGFGLALAVYGELVAGVLVLVAATVVWWVNLLPALGSGRRTLVDRLAGTVVIRRELYSQVAAHTAQLARRTSGAAVVAGRMGADAAVVAAQVAAEAAAAAHRRGAQQLPIAARRTSDAAAAAARKTAAAAADAAAVAKQGAERLKQAAPVQQALHSKTAQQGQDLARKVGGRAQELWRERRSGRPPDGS